MSLLERILASKRAELPALRQRKLPTPGPRPPVELARLPGGPLHLITEIKRRSPSAGELSTKLDVTERAHAYERGGASMLSILCDGPFFGGDYADLLAARRGTAVPLLCKEFIIDECQLDAARAHGASAALLIVRCLSAAELKRLVAAAIARELLPLVEVIDPAEGQVAVDAGATVIGVNARDLDTLAMDGSRAARVLESLPGHVSACHFSGIKSAADITELRKGAACAALIGEALMRQDDPLPLLQGFVQAARATLS